MEKNANLTVLAKVLILIFLYILCYHFFVGIKSLPTEGDSVDYHIPIAQNLIKGNIINPDSFFRPQYFYPANAEIVLSLFILLGIPLNIYNVFAVILLFFASKKLGKVFGFSNSYAIIFAIAICSLGGVTRWLNTQIIDIWLAVFYVALFAFLESNKKKTVTSALVLGLLFGLLIGTKYTGLMFGGILLIFYYKKLLKMFSVKNLFAFLIPVGLIGFFWYIRNFIFMQNPFYPIDTPIFKGHLIFPDRVWNVMVRYPIDKANAFFSEYRFWMFSIIIIPFILKFTKINKIIRNKAFFIFSIGVVNFLIYLNFISSHQEWIMVSVMRYAFPVFIPLILCCFLLAKYFKKEEILGFLVIASMLIFNSYAYFPKLLFIVLPFWFLCIKFLINDTKMIKEN